MSFKCLNVKIDNLSQEEILNRIESADNLQIATVNPEFILEAQKNEEFKNILNSNKTLCVADGIGLKFAAWRYGENLKCRWAGIDLMWEILKVANEKKQSIFLIANKNGLSTWQETAIAIRKVYPKLEVDGIDISTRAINHKVSNTKYDIIFCSLGAPYQEILLHKLQSENLSFVESDEKINSLGEESMLFGSETEIKFLPNHKLMMGVGGSFDFITGKIKRSPRFIQRVGLEWLWRLVIEPRYRLERIYNATIVFPIKVMFKK
jgi:N-acetylglucosaminyldiphosphoundecaprenol N-acetyl-beta-D-mannosaminyltransferase